MTDEIDRTAEALLWTLQRLARVDEPWRHNRADAIDEVTRALSAARAAEPPQPASVGGVDPAFTSHMPELLMRLHAQRYPAAANNPTTLGAVWIGESRTPPELLAEALAQPPHTCAVDNDCAECKAIMTDSGDKWAAFGDGFDRGVVYARARAAEPPQPASVGGVEARGPSSPDDLRDAGWCVAVHNDYRLHGSRFTFWLVTKEGRCLKGEGASDAVALAQIRAQLAAAEPPHPSNEELVAQMRDWILQEVSPTNINYGRGLVKLSELERRLTASLAPTGGGELEHLEEGARLIRNVSKGNIEVGGGFWRIWLAADNRLEVERARKAGP